MPCLRSKRDAAQHKVFCTRRTLSRWLLRQATNLIPNLPHRSPGPVLRIKADPDPKPGAAASSLRRSDGGAATERRLRQKKGEQRAERDTHRHRQGRTVGKESGDDHSDGSDDEMQGSHQR